MKVIATHPAIRIAGLITLVISCSTSATAQSIATAAEQSESLPAASHALGIEEKSDSRVSLAFGELAKTGPDAKDPAIALIGHAALRDGCDCCEVPCLTCGGCCNSCKCPVAEAACVEYPRVTTQSPHFNINVFGALKLDMLFNESRPVSPGTPFFLTPGAANDFREQTFDIHARQSTLGAALVGPKNRSLSVGRTSDGYVL